MKSILLSLALIFAVACTDMSQTEKALETYEKNTAELNEKLDEAFQKQTELGDKIGKLMSSGQKASHIFSPSVMGEYAAHGKKSVELGKEYLFHYREFLSSIDDDSTCYQPEIADRIESIILEREAFFQQLDELPKFERDDEAILTWLGTGMAQSQITMIMPMINMTYLCLISDAFGMTKEDLEKIEKENAANDFDSTESIDEGLEEIYKDTHQISKTVRPGDTLLLNNYLPEYADNVSQVANIEIPKGLKFAKDSLEIVMPMDKVATEYVFKGNYQISDTIWTLNITLINKPQQLISELTFSDSSLQNCVDLIVKATNFTYVEDFTTLHCDFGDTTFSDVMKQPIKDISGIDQLEYLEDIKLMDNQIDDFRLLTKLDKLSMIYIKGEKLKDLSWAGKRDKFSLVLENTEVEDISAIDTISSGLIGFIDAQPSYCDQFERFENQDRIFLYYGPMQEYIDGLSETEMPEMLGKMQSDPDIMLQAPKACQS